MYTYKYVVAVDIDTDDPDEAREIAQKIRFIADDEELNKEKIYDIEIEDINNEE